MVKVSFYINDGDQTLNVLLMSTSIIGMHLILQLVGSCGKIMGSIAKLSWRTTFLHKF